MGGQSTSTQTVQSQSAPWAAAQPVLQTMLSQIGTGLNNTGLTSAESSALDTLKNNAAAGNPYTGQIASYAQSLLNGGGATAQAGNVQDNLASQLADAIREWQHGWEQSGTYRAACTDPVGRRQLRQFAVCRRGP